MENRRKGSVKSGNSITDASIKIQLTKSQIYNFFTFQILDRLRSESAHFWCRKRRGPRTRQECAEEACPPALTGGGAGASFVTSLLRC
jgi:hypothetical protein